MYNRYVSKAVQQILPYIYRNITRFYMKPVNFILFFINIKKSLKIPKGQSKLFWNIFEDVYFTKSSFHITNVYTKRKKNGNRTTIYNYHSITRQRPCDHDYCVPAHHLRKFITCSVDDDIFKNILDMFTFPKN
jgi:hypothetical protein